MGSVITLVPPAPPSPPGCANADVVAQLKLLLTLAEQGSITSFAYIAVGDPHQCPATGYSGDHKNAMIAGMPMLLKQCGWVEI